MNRRIIGPIAMLAALVAAFAAACGEKKKSENPCPENETFLYDGLASDETCKSILDAEDAGAVVAGGPNAPVLVVPTAGGTVASAPDVTLSWTSAIDGDGDLARVRLRERRATTDQGLRWQDLFRGLSPVSTAWAHKPPVTGAVHRIVLSGASGEIARLHTTRLHWTLTPGLRDAVVAEDGLSLDVLSVYLTENRILNPATDGPFALSAPVTFEVAP